ncbi:MAG: AI-2E family transporter [Clostridia bacterium]|nr:AI-2E family transporter [Clostridia bacterium]
MKKIENKTLIKIGLSILGLYLVIHYWTSISGAVGTVFSAAAPLLFGFVISYPLNILMNFYERHWFPNSKKKIAEKSRRPVCLTGSILTVIGIISLIVVLVAPQLVNCIKLLVAEVPDAINMLVEKLKTIDFISKDLINTLSSIDWKSRINDIIETVTSGLGSAMNVAVTAVTSIFSVVANLVLGLIFALYLLLDKNRLVRQLKKVTEKYVPERWLSKATHILGVINDSFHRFIVGQCTEAVILGSLCTIGMAILRLPYAAMIGALIAFTALIPIVGAFIGAGVGAFLILMESPMKALIFLVFIVVLQQLEGNLIYPKVVGSSIGLPGIWVLAAVTVGGGVMGIWGMLVGVPMAAAVYRLVKEEVNRQPKVEAVREVCNEDPEQSE